MAFCEETGVCELSGRHSASKSVGRMSFWEAFWGQEVILGGILGGILWPGCHSGSHSVARMSFWEALCGQNVKNVQTLDFDDSCMVSNCFI